MSRRSHTWAGRFSLAAVVIFLFGIFIPLFPVPAESSDSHSPISRTIRHLSSLGGRGLGTAEGRAARDFIASRFSAIGLESVEGGSFQPFTVTVRSVDTATLMVDEKQVLPDDFVPLAFSSAGAVKGEVVFVGHGLDGDDYAERAVRGKVAVALAGTPVPVSRREGNEAVVEKVRQARDRGALALIILEEKPFVSGYSAWPDRVPPSVHQYWKKKTGDDLDSQLPMKVTQHLSMLPMPEEFDFPCLMVNREVLDPETARQVSFLLTTREQDMVGANVLGLLRGSGKSGELLVIGAHYDHLGRDKEGMPYPGADDNASGVAAMLEVAKNLTGLKSRLGRDILFIAFDGEEWGLKGSARYVSRPPFPLKRTVAMINLDTVGRNKPDAIYLIGSRQNPEIFPLAVEAGQEAGLSVMNTLDFAFPWGSDHYPFYQKGVPAVDLSSSLHEDYHRITDTADRVDAAKVARVADMVTRLARAIAGSDIRFPEPLDIVVPYPKRGE